MIYLRELSRRDLAVINRWRNDPELISRLGCNRLFIGEETDEQWFDDYLQHRDKAVRLAIVLSDCHELIGCVNLTGLHRINRSAEFSIMIGSTKHRGLGAGRAATKQMLAHGFMDLNLYRIYLYVLRTNLQAIQLYQKVGFSSEGVLRSVLFKNGEFVDEVVMSFLRPEFEARRQGEPAAARTELRE